MSLQLIKYNNLWNYFIYEADIGSSTLIIDQKSDIITLEFFVNTTLIHRDLYAKITKKENWNLQLKNFINNNWEFHIYNQVYKIVEMSVYEPKGRNKIKEIHIVIAVCLNFLRFLTDVKRTRISPNRYKEMENLDTLILTTIGRGYYDGIKFKDVHHGEVENYDGTSQWGCICHSVYIKLEHFRKWEDFKKDYLVKGREISYSIWFEWQEKGIATEIKHYTNTKNLWENSIFKY